MLSCVCNVDVGSIPTTSTSYIACALRLRRAHLFCEYIVVKIIYSQRKSMSLQVLDTGEVIARVPRHMSERRVQAFIEAHEAWIERALAKARQRRENTVYMTQQDVEELREQAKKYLIPRTYELAARMKVHPQNVTIRNQKTRWGSCSARQTLSLNCQLMVLPEDVRDYVIIHELCHLVHFNHSPAFWELVRTYVPNVAAYRKRLRDYIIQPLECATRADT